MKFHVGPTFFFRAVGVFLILLEASLWPHVQGQVILGAVGFMGSAEFFDKQKK